MPLKDDAADLLRQLVLESHLMIKLTAITAEEEPHSTVAAFLVSPTWTATWCMPAIRASTTSAAPSMVQPHHRPLVRAAPGRRRQDQRGRGQHPSAVQPADRLPGHPADPPLALWHIDKLELGDTLLACSDGLWHYFTPKELGAIVHALPPREASEMLVSKARQRARGGGDNLSLALVRIDALK